MPALKTYNVFISHAWKYDDDYYKIVNMLNDAPNFKWKNYSVPSHDPLIDPNTTVGKNKLNLMLEGQIRYAHIVLVVSGMYVAHRYWLQSEIDIAQSYRKPIVGVTPWGQINVPLLVQEASEQIVGRRTDSIVSAIRNWSI